MSTISLSEDLSRRGQLYFTIGLPKSGKSTFCSDWARAFAPVCPGDTVSGLPRAIVCADNIRTALHGRVFNRYAEPMVFAIKQYMIEALLSRGHDVIVDGTHTTCTSIRRILELDLDARWFLVDTAVHVCKARAIGQDYRELIPVIDRCAAQLAVLKEHGVAKAIGEIRHEIQVRNETLW